MQQFTIGADSDLTNTIQLYNGGEEVWGNPFPQTSPDQVNFKMRLAWFPLDNILNPSEDIPTYAEFATAFLAFLNYHFTNPIDLGSSPSVTATLGDKYVFDNIVTQSYNVQFSSSDTSKVLALVSDTTTTGCLSNTDPLRTQLYEYNWDNFPCDDGGPTPLQRSLRPYFDNHAGLDGAGYVWPTLNWGEKTLANHDSVYGEDWDYDSTIRTTDVHYVAGEIQIYPITFKLRLGWPHRDINMWPYGPNNPNPNPRFDLINDIPLASELANAFLAWVNYEFTVDELGTNQVVTATWDNASSGYYEQAYVKSYDVSYSSSDPWAVWDFISDETHLGHLENDDVFKRLFGQAAGANTGWDPRWQYSSNNPGSTAFQRSLGPFFNNHPNLEGKGYTWPDPIDWAGNNSDWDGDRMIDADVLMNFYDYDWSYDKAIVLTEANNPNIEQTGRRLDSVNSTEGTDDNITHNGTSTDMTNHTHVHNARALQGKLTKVGISSISRPTLPIGTSSYDFGAIRHTHHNPHALEGHLAMVNIENVTNTIAHLDVGSNHSRRHLAATVAVTPVYDASDDDEAAGTTAMLSLSECGYYDKDIEYAGNSIGWMRGVTDHCGCRLACAQSDAPYYSFDSEYSTGPLCRCKALRTSLTTARGTHSGVTTAELGRFECTVMPYVPPSPPPPPSPPSPQPALSTCAQINAECVDDSDCCYQQPCVCESCGGGC